MGWVKNKMMEMRDNEDWPSYDLADKTAAYKMGREKKTVYGEAMVSRQGGTTDNQLYS